jgi:hypothetical protein
MTAAQELIKKIKVRIPFFQYSVYQDDFDAAIEKEKLQIMNAHCSGWQKGFFNENNDWLAHYNQAYICPIHNEALNEDGLCNTCLENSNK